MYMNLAARRRRKASGGAPPLPLDPPVILTPPQVAVQDINTLFYTPGTWEGAQPITLEGRFWLMGEDVAPAAPGENPIQPEWRGKVIGVHEIATNADGQETWNSDPVGVPVVVPPTTEGPFDGRDWQDLPVGGTFCDLTAYGWFNVDRFQYLFQFRTPRGPVNEQGRYTFRLEEDGELATTFAFMPDQLPTTVEASFQSIRPNTSRLTVTTNNGDVILFDVRVPIFTGPGQFAPPGFAPAVRTPPDLDLSPDNDTLLYTPGVWAGELAPAVTARLFVDGADTAPAVPSMPVQPAWRGKECGVREAATNAAGGPVFALSPEVMPPAPPPINLDAAIASMLAGTTGFVFDPQDDAVLSLIHNGTSPINGVGDPIGRILSKHGAGPQRQVFQSALAGRPLLKPDRSLFFDAVDDGMASGAANFIGRNVPAAGIFARVRLNAAAMTGQRPIIFGQTSEGTGNQNERLMLWVQDARLMASCRRPDVGGASGVLTAPAALEVERDYTVGVDYDFAGATPTMRLWIDNAMVAEGPISGTPGNTTATDNLRTGLGLRHTTSRYGGRIGRVFYSPFIPTPSQRTIIEAWLKAPPPSVDPETDLLVLFDTKRLGYVVDPRDKSTMLQDSLAPVTGDGQGVRTANIRLKSSATLISFTNTAVSAQPLWVSDELVADGVDDNLAFPAGGTAVQVDFGNLAGFVASLLVTPGPLPTGTQAFWTVGFGGTPTNNRLRIWGSPNGAVGFSAHDGVARRDFSTPAGLLVPGTPILLTLFVDYKNRSAKGFVDGVERASFTLLNTTDVVNVDSNRCTLFRNHGAGEFSNAKLHRAAFLHDRTDEAGRIVMENWVKEAP